MCRPPLPGVGRPLRPEAAGDEIHLYDSQFFKRLPPRFRVLPDGSIFNWFDDLTPWSLEDLRPANESRPPDESPPAAAPPEEDDP